MVVNVRCFLHGDLMGDSVVDYSHDWSCFRHISMGIAPVRELNLAKPALAFLTAHGDKNAGVENMYRMNSE